jgi:hypothetical protein
MAERHFTGRLVDGIAALIKKGGEKPSLGVRKKRLTEKNGKLYLLIIIIKILVY